ncbi:MAG: hypothetical protein H6817_05225 [Phycisphaerales bacterium]|nr:hypothetical protein [Phycisphaerales bacterium]
MPMALLDALDAGNELRFRKVEGGCICSAVSAVARSARSRCVSLWKYWSMMSQGAAFAAGNFSQLMPRRATGATCVAFATAFTAAYLAQVAAPLHDQRSEIDALVRERSPHPNRCTPSTCPEQVRPR